MTISNGLTDEQDADIMHIWAFILWAVALILLILSEAMIMEADTHKPPHELWSSPMVYIVLMIFYPTVTAERMYQRRRRLPRSQEKNGELQTWFLYLGWFLLTTNGTLFMCIVMLLHGDY